MSLFGKLFGKRDAPSVFDPVFGRLTYDGGIWTHVPRSPERGFMITIAAPQSGPSNEQKALLQRIRKILPALEQQAKEFLGIKAKDEMDVGRLSVYSLAIGTDAETRSERFVMELSDADTIVIHRVSFEAGKPTHYTHDD